MYSAELIMFNDNDQYLISEEVNNMQYNMVRFKKKSILSRTVVKLGSSCGKFYIHFLARIEKSS